MFEPCTHLSTQILGQMIWLTGDMRAWFTWSFPLYLAWSETHNATKQPNDLPQAIHEPHEVFDERAPSNQPLWSPAPSKSRRHKHDRPRFGRFEAPGHPHTTTERNSTKNNNFRPWQIPMLAVVLSRLMSQLSQFHPEPVMISHNQSFTSSITRPPTLNSWSLFASAAISTVPSDKISPRSSSKETSFKTLKAKLVL